MTSEPTEACPLEAEPATPPLEPATGARTVIAMSGGVDSSVAAWLLSEAGHDLVGLFMRNGVEVEAAEIQKKSGCSISDARDARMVAARLGIPFQAVDLKTEFGSIISYFLSEYGKGRTPNPCAVCNRDLKFDRLLRFAEEPCVVPRRDGALRTARRDRRSRLGQAWRRPHEGSVVSVVLRRRGEPQAHATSVGRHGEVACA